MVYEDWTPELAARFLAAEEDEVLARCAEILREQQSKLEQARELLVRAEPHLADNPDAHEIGVRIAGFLDDG